MIMLKSYQHLKSALITLAVVCALVGATAPAQADHLGGDCRGIIVTVQGDLTSVFDNGGYTGLVLNKQKTYTGLFSKLENSITKLEQHKYADAKQKLQDFKDAVILMRDAAKPKLSKDAAALLLDGTGETGVNGAIECVCLLP
jgi:hypothetical protein